MVRPEDQAFVRWRSAGDADALAQVYDLAAPALLRLALHHVRHPATAEDLVQATFVAAIQNAASYDPARPLLGWLVGILHNQAKWLQRREGRAVDPQRVNDRPPSDPLAAAQASEFTAQCDEAIEGLPEAYRPVLRLHLKHELNAAEIAHVLGRPPGTVRSQITRGLELLRAALPAGIALAAFAVLTPGRGLAAVREVVLATARTHAATLATAVAAKAIVGGVTMKKGVLGVAALLGLAAGAWLFASHRIENARARPDAAPQAAVAAIAPATDRAAAPTSEPPLRELAPAAPVSWQLVGTVMDPTGRPIGDATVRVGLRFEQGSEPFTDVRTGGDGRYAVDLTALRALPPIDLARLKLGLCFEAPGQMADGTVLLPHHDPARPLIVVGDAMLVPGAVLSGRVVDFSGRPVAGARVSLRWTTGEGKLPDASAETDPHGCYRIAVQSVAPAAITAHHQRFGRAEAPCELAVGRDIVQPDLVLRASSTLRARVTFADGEPAEDVDVGVYEPGNEGVTVAMATTDREGCIAVCTLAPGRYQLQVRAHTREAREALLRPIVGTDEDPATLVLTGVHQLRFRYEDETGRPLRPLDVAYGVWPADQAAAAAAFAAGGALPKELERGLLRGAGSLSSILVGSGTWMRVEASHRDARAETMLQALPPQNVHDVVLTLRELERSATLRLNLTSADAEGPGDVELRLRQLHLGAPGSYRLEPEHEGASLLVRWHPGRYRLEGKPKEYGSQFGWFAPFEQLVELRRSAETVVDIVVRPGGRVRLQLQAPEQRAPIQDLSVETPAATDAAPGLRNTFIQVRPDGWESTLSPRADVPLLWPPVLPPGRHLLTIRSRDYADITVSVTIEARTVTDVPAWLQPR